MSLYNLFCFCVSMFKLILFCLVQRLMGESAGREWVGGALLHGRGVVFLLKNYNDFMRLDARRCDEPILV